MKSKLRQMLRAFLLGPNFDSSTLTKKQITRTVTTTAVVGFVVVSFIVLFYAYFTPPRASLPAVIAVEALMALCFFLGWFAFKKLL